MNYVKFLLVYTILRMKSEKTPSTIDPRLGKIIDCLYRISSKAVIIRDNKLMLVQEAEGWYGLPGGGVDHGLSLREGLIRELSEELGVELTLDRIPEEPVFFKLGGVHKRVPRMNVYYKFELDDDELKNPSELDHSWVTADELATIELGPSIKLSRQNLLELLT